MLVLYMHDFKGIYKRNWEKITYKKYTIVVKFIK